jgi:hypothetical protein
MKGCNLISYRNSGRLIFLDMVSDSNEQQTSTQKHQYTDRHLGKSAQHVPSAGCYTKLSNDKSLALGGEWELFCSNGCSVKTTTCIDLRPS